MTRLWTKRHDAHQIGPEQIGAPAPTICAPDSFLRRKLDPLHTVITDSNNYAQKLIHQARYSTTSTPIAGFFDPPFNVALNTSSFACPVWQMPSGYATRKVRFVRSDNVQGHATFIQGQSTCTVTSTAWTNGQEMVTVSSLPEGTTVVSGGGTTSLTLSHPALASGSPFVYTLLPDSWYSSSYQLQGFCDAVPIPLMADLPSWWAGRWGAFNLQATGSDEAAAFYQPSTGKYWEFWQFQGNETAGYTAVFGGYEPSLPTNEGVMPQGSGTRAGGIPCAAGCIYAQEFYDGIIPHALSLALPVTAPSHLPPLTRNDSSALVPSSSFADAIPEGAMFRFPANITINPSWSRFIQMVVSAVRDYGLYIADTSGTVQFNGEDPRVVGTQFSGAPLTASGSLRYLTGVDPNELTTVFPWEQIQQIAYP